MTALSFFRRGLLPAVGLSFFALLTSCATTESKSVQDDPGMVSFKTVDDGVLDVVILNKGQQTPFQKETYSIEKGSDGTWTVAGQVQPADTTQPSRDVRLELGSGMTPVSYSEESGGGAMKIFISFVGDKATVMSKAAGANETTRELPGKFEAVVWDRVYHHPAVLARLYAEKNPGAPMELRLFAEKELKVVVSELEPATLQRADGPMEVRHFMVEIAGSIKEHVWLSKSDLKILKLEIPRGLTATKVDVPEAASLTAVVAPPPPPPAPAAAPAPAAPPAPPAAPAPEKK